MSPPSFSVPFSPNPLESHLNKTFLAAAVLSTSLFACGEMMMTSDSGTTTDAGTDAGTAAPTCASYCTTVMANCTGANSQYANEASCLGSCSAFTQGTTGATSGNSLSCRAYHAGAAPSDAALHCPHAGPAGDGACGGNCESFCTIAVAKCSANFANTAACTAACMGFAMNTARYTSATTSGDSFSCRMYHLSVAATDTASATTHCPHTTAASAPGTCQ
jgi:hypothetical protein